MRMPSLVPATGGSSFTPSCISIAAAVASPAEGNTAITSSPMVLITRPPCSCVLLLNSVMQSSMATTATASPAVSYSFVLPLTSTNRTATSDCCSLIDFLDPSRSASAPAARRVQTGKKRSFPYLRADDKTGAAVSPARLAACNEKRRTQRPSSIALARGGPIRRPRRTLRRLLFARRAVLALARAGRHGDGLALQRNFMRHRRRHPHVAGEAVVDLLGHAVRAEALARFGRGGRHRARLRRADHRGLLFA